MRLYTIVLLIGSGAVLYASDSSRQWNPDMDWDRVRKHAIAQVVRGNKTRNDLRSIAGLKVDMSSDVINTRLGRSLDGDAMKHRQQLLAAELVGPKRNPVASVNTTYPEDTCREVVNQSGLNAYSMLGFTCNDYFEHGDVEKVRAKAQDKLDLYYTLLNKRKHLFADERMQQFLNTTSQTGIDTSQWTSLEALDKKVWEKINHVYNTPIHPAIEIDIDTRLTPLSDTSGE